jgi:hypothetical protein
MGMILQAFKRLQNRDKMPSAHSGTGPTGPRKARPDEREPGISEIPDSSLRDAPE